MEMMNKNMLKLEKLGDDEDYKVICVIFLI